MRRICGAFKYISIVRVFRTQKYRNMRVRYSGKCWSRRRPSCRYTSERCRLISSFPSTIDQTSVKNVRQNLLEERTKNPSPSLEERIERAKRRAHQVSVKIQQDLVKRRPCFSTACCHHPPHGGTDPLPCCRWAGGIAFGVRPRLRHSG